MRKKLLLFLLIITPLVLLSVFLAITSSGLKIKEKTSPTPISTPTIFQKKPTPSLSTEEEKEKQLQENYARQRESEVKNKPWLLKLPLKSAAYFISYDPENDVFLATVYYYDSQPSSKEDQVAEAKKNATDAIRALGALEDIVFIEIKR